MPPAAAALRAAARHRYRACLRSRSLPVGSPRPALAADRQLPRLSALAITAGATTSRQLRPPHLPPGPAAAARGLWRAISGSPWASMLAVPHITYILAKKHTCRREGEREAEGTGWQAPCTALGCAHAACRARARRHRAPAFGHGDQELWPDQEGIALAAAPYDLHRAEQHGKIVRGDAGPLDYFLGARHSKATYGGGRARRRCGHIQRHAQKHAGRAPLSRARKGVQVPAPPGISDNVVMSTTPRREA